MSSPARNEMDVDAFLPWAQGRAGRWELRDGQPVMRAPERALHALTKYASQKVLENGIVRAGLHCRVFPDGMTVRVGGHTAFEPDALVVCPPPSDLNTMEIPNPVIVVEVRRISDPLSSVRRLTPIAALTYAARSDEGIFRLWTPGIQER